MEIDFSKVVGTMHYVTVYCLAVSVGMCCMLCVVRVVGCCWNCVSFVVL